MCPEPVLAKRSFIYINGSKKEEGVFAPGKQPLRPQACKSWARTARNRPFKMFSLCLSRACLGKVIRFGIKRGNFRPFSYLHRAEQPVADEVACGAVRENAILFA